MCNAGRIKYHLRSNISDARNSIVFVGYQAHGTLGRSSQVVPIQFESTDENTRYVRNSPIIWIFRHTDQQGLMDWVEFQTDA